MNNLDKDYLSLCQDILDNGTKKQTRTGTDAISVFGRQIRHKMSDGFPLLTTKKMAWKQIVTELLWFLRGDTNIKFLLDNDCHIWDGDAYKNYCKTYPDVEKTFQYEGSNIEVRKMTQEEFINEIKTDDEFAKKWGDLGPIYGKQWRSWKNYIPYDITMDGCKIMTEVTDQIANLTNELKTNPDSRRLMVSAWNVGELDQMVLPPCHYGFQVYTRELSLEERYVLYFEKLDHTMVPLDIKVPNIHQYFTERNIPTRAISLMWNQRSVDVPLGLPFNIASYGLLLHILAEATNMIPDELIGNLGDCHIYENQIDGIKEQIGRELTIDERIDLASNDIHFDPLEFGVGNQVTNEHIHKICDEYGVPRRTRQPYELPKLFVNSEFWNHEYNTIDGYINSIEIEDFPFEHYQFHPSIKIPLSN
jgi:thymidylate synthase